MYWHLEQYYLSKGIKYNTNAAISGDIQELDTCETEVIEKPSLIKLFLLLIFFNTMFSYRRYSPQITS
jgi:hypothetical protein